MQINNTNVAGTNQYEVQSMVDPIVGPLPADILPIIFQNGKTDLPNLALVCKNWKAIVDNTQFCETIRPAIAFGVQEWKEYIGVDAGEEPRLPRRAYGDLEKEGGLLTFIPEKVKVIENGFEVFLDNLKVIGKLVGNPKKGNKTGYTRDSCRAISEDRKQEKPHWVWIKKEVIGRGKSYEQQQELVAKTENKKAPGAKISGLIDTAISVFMEYVRSGEQIFVWDPPVNFGQRTWVRVNEQFKGSRLGVGFAPSGLNVHYCYDHNDDYKVHIAVAPARKSFGH